MDEKKRAVLTEAWLYLCRATHEKLGVCADLEIVLVDEPEKEEKDSA